MLEKEKKINLLIKVKSTTLLVSPNWKCNNCMYAVLVVETGNIKAII